MFRHKKSIQENNKSVFKKKAFSLQKSTKAKKQLNYSV